MTWQSNRKFKKQYKLKAIGKHISDYAFEPGPFSEKQKGRVAVEGPAHYHTWYASVELDDEGVVVKIS